MSKYLAVDSGGTKVLAILYDEHFRPLAISRTGSFRDNTTSEELIRRNMEQLKKDLGLTADIVLDQVSGVICSGFLEFLTATCRVLRVDNIGETEMGLPAAGIFGDGILTLSGTGSNSAAIYRGQHYIAGGYGASVSDVGSGYWMGREAMNAAIADFEERGAGTLLTDLIAGHFGETRDQLNQAILSIYRHKSLSPAAQVASCAPLISQAAEAGDTAALGILQAAGQVLGDQTTALIRKFQLPDALPLTISGSVWRSHRILFDTFLSCIHRQSPHRPVRIPDFEPVIGILLRHCFQQKGDFTLQDHDRFAELYPQFLFRLPYTIDE